MNAIPCTICQKPGHHCRSCPELSAPLLPGFFAPKGGGGGHSHDEDEKVKVKIKKQIPPPVLQITRV